MKKIALILMFMLTSSGCKWFRSPESASPYYNSEKDAHISTFFKFAKEELPTLIKKIDDLKKNKKKNELEITRLENDLNTYKIAIAIADRNNEALLALGKEILEGPSGQIWVNAEKFSDQMNGLLQSAIIGGNAIGLTIMHSALDKTIGDSEKTLETLKALLSLNLKLDDFAAMGTALFIKDRPEDKRAYDYVTNLSLTEGAIAYGSPEILELLLKHGAKINKRVAENLINSLQKDNISYSTDFTKVLKKYPKQVTQDVPTNQLFLPGLNNQQ